MTRRVEQANQEAEERFFNFRPLLFTAIALCFGVYFGFLYKVKEVPLWWISVALLAIATFLGVYFRKSVRKFLTALFVVSLSFCIGFGSFSFSIKDYEETTVYEGAYTVTGVVAEYEEGKTAIYVVIKDVTFDGKEAEGNLITYLSTTYAGKIHLSDTLLLTGKVKTDVRIIGSYGFKASAINDDLRYRLETESVEVTGKVFNPFSITRERMRKVLYAGMDDTYASVCFALLTGNVSGIESGLLQNVRYGGIAHIFAVSGLHIGALYAFCLFLIRKTKFKNLPKPFRFIAVATVLVLYGGICGYSASVIRATVTCLVFYVSKLIGYGSDGLERVGASGICVLLLAPVSLFEVGFQLSFTACLGIVLLSKPIGNALLSGCKAIHLYPKEEKKDVPLGIRESAVRSCVSFLGVTISAQLATLPISCFWFGYVSVFSLLLNCLYVPIIGALFPIQLFFTFVACILPTTASIVIFFPLKGIWAVLVLLFELFAFSVVDISGITITGGAIICYYLSFILLTDKWNLSKIEKIGVSLLFMVASILCLVFASV